MMRTRTHIMSHSRVVPAVYFGAPLSLTLHLAAHKHFLLRGLDVYPVLRLSAEPRPVEEERS